MRARLLDERDISLLLSFIPGIENQSSVWHETKLLLKDASFYRSKSIAEYSRVFSVNEVQGFLSANLISLSADSRLVEHASLQDLYDPSLRVPLSMEELRKANRSDGSSLYITSFFWQDNCSFQERYDFMQFALDHLARWFEGNTVSRITFPVWDKYLESIQPILSALDERQIIRKSISESVSLIQINGPWKPIGLAPGWVKKLLTPCPDPVLEIEDRHKFIGRLFYEFDFEIADAISGCLNWKKPAGKKLEKLESYAQWRTPVARSLNVGGAGAIEGIKEIFIENPRILTYY